MRPLRPAVVLFSALHVLGGCATRQPAPAAVAAAPADPAAPGAAAAPSRALTDRNVITNAEIAQFGGSAGSLYDFIRTRHNDWFRSNAASIARPTQTTGATGGGAAGTWATGSSSTAYPVRVFMDGQPFGEDPTVLRTVPLNQVAMARRLSPSQGQAKYGLNNNGGVIEVWTRLDRVR